MIKWLYTITVSRGTPEHVWSPKTTDIHFANAWVQAVIDNPDKNIIIKNLGLQFPTEETFEAMKLFDVIFVHMISIRDIGPYRWNEFPKVIREKLGKDCPKIYMAIDDEPNHIPPHRHIVEAMNDSDLIASVSKNCLDEWSQYTKTPVRYLPSPKYYNQVMNPVPINEREKKIAVMNHTGIPIGSGGHVGIKTQLDVVANLGVPVKIFTGWFNQSPEVLKEQAMSQRISEDKIEAFTRLNRVDYFKKLSTCWVGLEDEYIGASRFAAECASLKIPVLGTEYITGAKVANPDLVTEPRNINEKIRLIKQLFEDEKFYEEQCEVAYKNITEHYSSSTCLDRLIGAWKEIGVNGT